MERTCRHHCALRMPSTDRFICIHTKGYSGSFNQYNTLLRMGHFRVVRNKSNWRTLRRVSRTPPSPSQTNKSSGDEEEDKHETPSSLTTTSTVRYSLGPTSEHYYHHGSCHIDYLSLLSETDSEGIRRADESIQFSNLAERRNRTNPSRLGSSNLTTKDWKTISKSDLCSWR